MKASVAILIVLLSFVTQTEAKTRKVPGVVVDYLPASSKTFIGSPSIVILPNGDYIASHDFFGPASTEHSRALTAVFRSSDKGKSWQKISEINGQFWSNLFVHRDKLYIMGCWKHHGNMIIRRSDDNGNTWTDPVNDTSGLIREGEFHTAPMPMVYWKGRICRAFENAKSNTTAWGKRYSAGIVSASVDADLLKSSSWSTTNFMPHDSTYLEGKFGGWLEGNAVVTPDGKLIDFLRVATSEKGRDLAAIVRISEDGLGATFDPSTGFFDFEGGSRKFSIRYDEQSGKYWTISNKVREEFASLPAGSVRNTLILQSSKNLKNWKTEKVLLSHPDVKKHGFQYVDWQFEEKDIIFLCRTAYDDQFGGADNYHNANYLTFHRIKNFRRLSK